MQKVFTKYWLAIQVGLSVIATWFLCARESSGAGPVCLLWLAVLCVETVFVLPSVRRGETLADARLRVVRALKKDPLLYLCLAVLLFACVQWMNSGCRLIYLPDADVWQFTTPVVAWAPFGISRAESLTQLSVLTCAAVVCLCVRHAMSLAGKRTLMKVLVLVSGAMAFCAVGCAGSKTGPFIRCMSGMPGFDWGTFFAFWMILGMGVFADSLVYKKKGVEWVFAVGILGNLCGMLFFCTALWIAVYSLVAVVLFVYWMAYLKTRVPRPVQVKLFLLSLLVVVVVPLTLIYVFPGNPAVGKIEKLLDFSAYWQSLSETRAVRTSAALKVWQDHPWIGVGADGFRHFAAAVIGDQNWKFVKVDPSCVYNDGVQLLCEYGLLGTGLLLFSIILLIAPVCHRARIAWRYGDPNEDERRWFLFRISPIVVTGTFALVLCLGQSWFESPFRSAAVLISWAVTCSALSAFLPAKAKTVKG